MATYVTNLVELIGLGIAIEYSLLVVYRFREELRRGGEKGRGDRAHDGDGRPRCRLSGTTVAIGLALLLAMPVPFIRSIGVGGFLIPVVSLAAAVTLQPALLSLYGVRGTPRLHPAEFARGRLRLPLPRITGSDPSHGFWARLAHPIICHPYAFLALGAPILVATADPVYGLQLTPRIRSEHPVRPMKASTRASTRTLLRPTAADGDGVDTLADEGESAVNELPNAMAWRYGDEKHHFHPNAYRWTIDAATLDAHMIENLAAWPLGGFVATRSICSAAS